MAQASSNGITIEYETHGDGEPLLLVMGLGGQLTDWPDGLIDGLVAAGFRVVTFDNRDIGLSTEFEWQPPKPTRAVLRSLIRRPPAAGYVLPDMAADAVGLLDALDIDAAHVVGMSMGGMIAQQLTIDHAHRVRSLTSIMSNTGDRKSGGISAKVMAKMARMPDPTPENAAQRSVDSFSLWSGPHFDPTAHRQRAQNSVERSFRPVGVQRQATAIMASPDRTPGLGQVAAATLVIHGMLDKLVKPSGGIATAKAVPGSRLIMYPDMGHDIPEPRVAEMVSEIRQNADREPEQPPSVPQPPA